MAEKEVCLKVDSDEFCCQICMEEFNKGPKCPRMLLCSHCFCHSCIETLISESPICPLCRETLEFTNAEKFPICFPFFSFLESYQKSLAEQMKDLHFSTERKNLSPSDFFIEGFCDEHKNTKQFRCMDCSDWVCGTCIVLNHKKCKTLLVKEALKEMQNEEVENINNILKVKSREEKGLSKINEMFEQELKHLKKEIKELQLKMNEKNKNVANLQIQLFEFLRQKKKREKLWIPVEESEMKSAEFLSNEQFESTKLQLNSDLNAVRAISTMADFKSVKFWLECDFELHVQDELLFSRLEFKNEKLRIHCFQTNQPKLSFITVPFKDLLSFTTGSDQIPTKAFLEIGPQGATSGQEVIVQTDAAVAGSPRVKNFLLLVAGLKGASYKGMPLFLGRYEGIDSQQHVTITSVWKKGGEKVEETVAEGIKDFDIYGRPDSKRGFVGGGKTECNSSIVYIFLEDSKYGSNMFGKFGEVESGLEALDQMKSGIELYVINCGFVVDV